MRIFSEKARKGSREEFLKLQDKVLELVKGGKLRPKVCEPNFSRIVEDFLRDYRKRGCPPVHHSRIYKQRNSPQYLVVAKVSTEKLLR